MSSVYVGLGSRTYEIAIRSDDPSGVGAFARHVSPKSSNALLVTDANVAAKAAIVAKSLLDSGLRNETTVVPSGEDSKCLAQLGRLYDSLADMRADRSTLVVAIGGGVTTDLAGFAAATYNRGIPILMIPTTLLAMVDASVGGKTGINHPKGKNLIGAFHQPVGVWIDTATLSTLPEREYRSGLAEVVKYGVIIDPDFFAFLETNTARILTGSDEALTHIIHRSCRIKADIVERDEREITEVRATLNFGHTFAHAYEVAAGYGNWLHGEAVATGMIDACRLGERLGLCSSELTLRVVRLLTDFGLPTKRDDSWSVYELIESMRRDKKAYAGKLRFVVPRMLGKVEIIDDVLEAVVREILV